jgi:hypothetical protein
MLMNFRLLAVVIAGGVFPAVAADADWKPKPDETYVVGDPRFEAMDAYREAAIMMRVYSDIKSRLKNPGDDADKLLTDFQPLAARTILKPLRFLDKYPDIDTTATLLKFQVTWTDGVWPGWKVPALWIFRNQPEEFAAFYKTLPAEMRAKLAEDVRKGLVMSSRDGPLIPVINPEEQDALKRRLGNLTDSKIQ